MLNYAFSGVGVSRSQGGEGWVAISLLGGRGWGYRGEDKMANSGVPGGWVGERGMRKYDEPSVDLWIWGASEAQLISDTIHVGGKGGGFGG